MLPSFLKLKPEDPTNRNEELIPEYTANILDKISFGWIYPLLKVCQTSALYSLLICWLIHVLCRVLQTGYTKPIEEDDVWHLDDARLTKTLSDKLERNFFDRCPPSRRPAHLGGSPRESAAQDGSVSSSSEGSNDEKSTAKVFYEGSLLQSGCLLSHLNPWYRRRKDTKVAEGKLDCEADEHGKHRYYDSSLAIALLQTTWRPLLIATAFKMGRSILDTTSSLVTKQLITYITASHAWGKASESERIAGALTVPKQISHGVGLAVGLALMQEVASLCGNHYYLQSYGCGEI